MFITGLVMELVFKEGLSEEETKVEIEELEQLKKSADELIK